MNRWDYNIELKEKYLPEILEYLKKLGKAEDVELELTGSGLAPYHLWKILEELGYTDNDIDDNGWEQDFWITLTKTNAPGVVIEACGMTQEVRLKPRYADE